MSVRCLHALSMLLLCSWEAMVVQGTGFRESRSHAGLRHGLALAMAGWASGHRPIWLGNAI